MFDAHFRSVQFVQTWILLISSFYKLYRPESCTLQPSTNCTDKNDARSAFYNLYSVEWCSIWVSTNCIGCIVKIMDLNQYTYTRFIDKKKVEMHNRAFLPFLCIWKNGLSVHWNKKLIIVFCTFQTVFQKFHGFHRIHVSQVTTQNPHAVQGIFVEQ